MRGTLAPGTLAIAKARSNNAKIGAAATTYVEQRSCPDSCVFKDGGGCYAEEGPVGKFITAPLNASARGVEAGPVEIARAEADAIDALEVVPGLPMRLHTVGDCATDEAARIVAAASRRYVERGGGRVWTYTHAWRTVARSSWDEVHVLASCETPEDVAHAHARGYATAMVVEEFAMRNLHAMQTVRLLPCPAQTTEGVSCASCRLCMDSERLHMNGITIGFAIHGVPVTVKRATAALRNPDDPDRKLSSRVLIPRFQESFKREHGRDPTGAEIARALDLHASSVYEMLRSLETGKPARSARRGRRRNGNGRSGGH